MSVAFFVALAAFVTTIANALGKCPTWVPLVLLCLLALLQVIPLR